ncbi:MAG: O-antigen ligase family protein [Patescibacteria group bacterium]|mgnify:CR=1 FL=1
MRVKEGVFVGLILATLAAAVFNRGGVTLEALMIFTGCTFLLAAAAVFERKKMENKIHFLTAILFLIFIGQFLISFTGSISENYGVYEFFLTLNGFFIFLIAQRLELDVRVRRLLSYGIIAIAVVSTLLGIYYYITLPFNRFTGSFLNPLESYSAFPNAYANFLLFVLPLAIYAYLASKKAWSFLATVLSLAFLLTGFALTFSRGAWMAFALVVVLTVLWLIIHRREVQWFMIRRGVMKLFLAGILSIVFIFSLQFVRAQRFDVNEFDEKVTLSADEGASSTSERREFWSASAEIIKDYFATGTGPGSFRFIYPRYQDTFGALTDHPHNVLLKIGVESGAFAAVTLAILILMLFFSIFRAGMFMYPMTLGLVGGVLHNMIDYNLNFASTTFLLWLFFGLLMGRLMVSEKGYLEKINTRHIGICVLAVSSIIISIAVHETYYNKIFRDGRRALVESRFDEAIVMLERSTPLIWERDLRLSLAEAYSGAGYYGRAQEALNVVLINKVENAAYANYYGELSEAKEDDTLALKWYRIALSYDPRNSLRYYYNTARLGGFAAVDIEKLLDEYAIRLSRNEHLTILTENPVYADKLFNWLLDNVPAASRAALQAKKSKFDEIWAAEKQKFGAKFANP